MLSHELAIEREFYRADFLPRADRRDKAAALYSILAFSLSDLVSGKRKVNILTEPGLELILGTFPQLNSSHLPLLGV